ncbi:MAG: hypothetical protein L6265_05535 [Thermoplasmatales archaeon]|nr:hypothetical protein [Thermoplasmatales archaeon]
MLVGLFCSALSYIIGVYYGAWSSRGFGAAFSQIFIIIFNISIWIAILYAFMGLEKKKNIIHSLNTVGAFLIALILPVFWLCGFIFQFKSVYPSLMVFIGYEIVILLIGLSSFTISMLKKDFRFIRGAVLMSVVAIISIALTVWIFRL